MEPILHGMESEVVSGTDGLSAVDAATGHPHGKPSWVVVASVAFFAHGGAPELAAPDDECFLEETARVKVLEKAGDGEIRFSEQFRVVAFDFCVCVPFASCAAVELDKADAAFNEAAGEETHGAELSGFGSVESVETFSGAGFGLRVEGIGRFELHSCCEFVGVDARFEVGVES